MAFVPVVYSGGDPVMRSDGVTQRVACPHLAQWLVVYDALQVARGRGHVVYYQTMGYSSASGGTHGCGSAWDMEYHGNAPIMDAREMGAEDWPRLASTGWTGGEHVHGVIRCGDNSCNGYQYTAGLAGYDGLGNGYARRDPLPKPATIRTWQQGIVWAQAEIARLTGPMTHTTKRRTTMLYHCEQSGIYYLATDFNVQQIEPDYADTAAVQWGAPVACLAEHITLLKDIVHANRIQSQATD